MQAANSKTLQSFSRFVNLIMQTAKSKKVLKFSIYFFYFFLIYQCMLPTEKMSKAFQFVLIYLFY
jgi:hypothetical protein